MAWKISAVHEEKRQNRHNRLLPGAQMTQTGWPEKQTEVENCIWGIGPEAMYQMTRAEYKTEQDKIPIKDS